MKTKVEIYDNSIISSVFFKSKISKIINSKLNEYGFKNAELIEIIGVGMAKKSGYGQYQNFVRLAVNNFEWISNHIQPIHYNMMRFTTAILLIRVFLIS